MISVTLGALHRRIVRGHSISELTPALRSIAKAGSQQRLWGSDWSHVNTDATGETEAPFLQVDEHAELEIIRTSMNEDSFDAMLRRTPEVVCRQQNMENGSCSKLRTTINIYKAARILEQKHTSCVAFIISNLLVSFAVCGICCVSEKNSYNEVMRMRYVPEATPYGTINS